LKVQVGEEAHTKSNWTRLVALGLTGLAKGEPVWDGWANVQLARTDTGYVITEGAERRLESAVRSLKPGAAARNQQQAKPNEVGAPGAVRGYARPVACLVQFSASPPGPTLDFRLTPPDSSDQEV
jgi:hypothetical protein